MLTILKPWRTGLDLKPPRLAWHEAFQRHVFSEHQLCLLKNFNVRYECYDARDEFKAQEEAKKNSSPTWLTEDLIEDMDHISFMAEQIENTILNDNDDEEHLDIVNLLKGRKTLANEAEMRQMDAILARSHWKEGSAVRHNIKENQLKIKIKHKTQSEWKQNLFLEKDNRIKSRKNGLPNNTTETSEPLRSTNSTADIVKIVDKSYLERDFKHKYKIDETTINSIIKKQQLNKEQERAFRIIANHICTPGLEQLKMYLGGMGGTGKSRVIQSIIELFKARNEMHRFLVLAPTGSAAALLNGSTYHSVLGFRNSSEGDSPNATTMSNMLQKLQGVDYIFFDEVSMLSCQKLYAVAARLSKRHYDQSVPFGGMNMIFAGDFAQLPPVMEGANQALYSGSVASNEKLSNYKIESAIGRSLWQQITTVVILRQNMRQKSQTPNDAKFRTALENMRYGACTPADIKFLQSMVANDKERNLSQHKFKYVPIIVTRNIQRDKINDLGCELFAKDMKEKLHFFHSEDEWTSQTSYEMNSERPKKGSRRKQLSITNKHIDIRIQTHLWNLPHTSSNHKAGILKLCKGMPVMIKYNIATECCITNGAEATVVDWQSHFNETQKEVLDVLFVRLVKPPTDIQLPGLAINVVPILPIAEAISCILANDKQVRIKRTQIPVLPNFAMTDYCSQGRTRTHNIVHLVASAYSLMSYYTALSRSSSADDTVILQDFDYTPFVDGISGYLRQEYRELDILDHITELKHMRNLPQTIYGDRRNDLIKKYRLHFGKSHMPVHTHKSLKWDSTTIWYDKSEDVPFQVDYKTKKSKRKQPDSRKSKERSGKRVKLHNSESNTKKRKNDDISDPSHKRPKINNTLIHTQFKPIGFKWDSVNWSCSYDSILYILSNTLLETKTPTVQLTKINKYVKKLAGELKKTNHITPEQVRNAIRQMLFNDYGNRFPLYGPRTISVQDLANILLSSASTTSLKHTIRCKSCIKTITTKKFLFSNLLNPKLYWAHKSIIVDNLEIKSAERWIKAYMEIPANLACRNCKKKLSINKIDNAPQIICLDLSSTLEFKNHSQIELSVHTKQSDCNSYHLKGIVYYRNNHFSASFVHQDDMTIWYNDGAVTKGTSVLYKTFTDLDKLLKDGWIFSCAIYHLM